MNKERNLMHDALFAKPESGAPKSSILLSDGTEMSFESKKHLMEKVQQEADFRRDSDQRLQDRINEYNDNLSKYDKLFETITVPHNMVIVKLARLPHIDPRNGFVIQRVLFEPSKSGADIQGVPVENKYPYYDFGVVVSSNSEWVEAGRFVQLSFDAVKQVFQREEGKFKYVLPNEFTLWNQRADERSNEDSLDCFVLIRDYMVEVMFPNDYKPTYE